MAKITCEFCKKEFLYSGSFEYGNILHSVLPNHLYYCEKAPFHKLQGGTIRNHEIEQYISKAVANPFVALKK